MKGNWIKLAAAAALAATGTTHAGIVVDFNNTTDLTTYFNGDSAISDSNVSAGGLNDSGRVQVNGSDCWTLKSGVALVAGTTYSASAYMYNAYNGGYGYLGFAIADANDVVNYGAPLNALGVSYHGGGGTFLNNQSSASAQSWSWPEDHPLGSWYLYTYTLTYNADNTFDGTFSIDQADSSGNILSHFGTQSFSGYSNAAVAGAGTIHPYFGTSGTGRYTSVDNYAAIPEPSVAALVGLFGGGLFAVRRIFMV